MMNGHLGRYLQTAELWHCPADMTMGMNTREKRRVPRIRSMSMNNWEIGRAHV